MRRKNSPQDKLRRAKNEQSKQLLLTPTVKTTPDSHGKIEIYIPNLFGLDYSSIEVWDCDDNI